MKRISLILNIVLLVLVGFLYYKVYSKTEPTTTSKSALPAGQKLGETPSDGKLKVAYLDLDTLQKHYSYFQKLKSEFENKQKSAGNELASLQKKYQNRTQELQQKAATMTPAQQEQAMNEINKMQQDFQARQQSLDNDLMNYNAKTQKEILEKIESFLKDYNKDGQFSYIFSFEPGFMLYKDSTLNITQNVLDGLNTLETGNKN